MTPVFTIHNQDCISGMAERLDPQSIDLCVTSIPFEDLFQYSNKLEDVGNNGNTIDIRAGRFALNLRFFIEQLFRVMKPGTNACIHVQQLLAFKCQHGFMGRRDFRGAVVDLFRAGGFEFAGEFTIAKDPQVIAIQLNLHSLQFKTGHSRSGTWLMPAPNDYVLIFQRPGTTPNPVRCIKHAANPGGWVAQDEWIRDAHGVWNDILMTDVLDVESGREGKHEKHVCPLQLSLIRRLVRLYTNPIAIQPGVTVLDPFMGIGSTAHVCLGGDCRDGRIESPRNVVGFELKESYHRAALDFASQALASGSTVGDRPSLFDALERKEAS